MKLSSLNLRSLFLTLVALCLVMPMAFAQGKPARDPKTGRFVKKAVAAKNSPARDPKTGRFMKKAPATAAAKKGPARDPKTGRFIKKK